MSRYVFLFAIGLAILGCVHTTTPGKDGIENPPSSDPKPIQCDSPYTHYYSKIDGDRIERAFIGRISHEGLGCAKKNGSGATDTLISNMSPQEKDSICAPNSEKWFSFTKDTIVNTRFVLDMTGSTIPLLVDSATYDTSKKTGWIDGCAEKYKNVERVVFVRYLIPNHDDSVKAALKLYDSLVQYSCKLLISCKQDIIHSQALLDLCNNDTTMSQSLVADGTWDLERSQLCTTHFDFYDPGREQATISSNIDLFKTTSVQLDSAKNSYWDVAGETGSNRRTWNQECSGGPGGSYNEYKLRQLTAALQN